jgi:sec-independent protein translocase protein TatA
LNTEVTKNITDEIKKVKDDLEDFTGSVKRKL